METKEEFEAAVLRLAARPPDQLARFIATLALDLGPVGDHVRTFIVGDDPEEMVAVLADRISHVADDGPYRRQRDLQGEDIGARLNSIVESIESFLMPYRPSAALRLLASVIEQDGAAMECCGDHHDEVALAIDRASDLIAHLAESLPREQNPSRSIAVAGR